MMISVNWVYVKQSGHGVFYFLRYVIFIIFIWLGVVDLFFSFIATIGFGE